VPQGATLHVLSATVHESPKSDLATRVSICSILLVATVVMHSRSVAGFQVICHLLMFAVFSTLLDGAEAMYCGDRNCYDVLKYAAQYFYSDVPMFFSQGEEYSCI
jgi:hypothetical protein